MCQNDLLDSRWDGLSLCNMCYMFYYHLSCCSMRQKKSNNKMVEHALNNINIYIYMPLSHHIFSPHSYQIKWN
jgi:hypothetical protein